MYCFRLLNVKCEKNIDLCKRIDNRTACRSKENYRRCGELGEAKVSYYQYMTLYECQLVESGGLELKTWCKSATGDSPLNLRPNF
jgi:hypothetical protein